MIPTNYVSSIHIIRQVTSSSNVGGAWLCFINGGLNFQIEHHLFPRMQHSHYPKIAPFVRKFCEDKGIPYVHFPTVQDNLASCVKHLFQMGHGNNSHIIDQQNRLVSSIFHRLLWIYSIFNKLGYLILNNPYSCWFIFAHELSDF